MPTTYGNDIQQEYRLWLISLAISWCGMRPSRATLMNFLFDTPFRPSCPNDENRAKDGVDFRLRFAEANPRYDYRDVYLYLDGPCNFLEMMMALATRCEEHIMGDPSEDDNTPGWFNEMLRSLHLYDVTDDKFSIDYVTRVIDIFDKREYAANGDGGLFTIHNPTLDMRNLEIWWQLNWYLSEKQ